MYDIWQRPFPPYDYYVNLIIFFYFDNFPQEMIILELKSLSMKCFFIELFSNSKHDKYRTERLNIPARCWRGSVSVLQINYCKVSQGVLLPLLFLLPLLPLLLLFLVTLS